MIVISNLLLLTTSVTVLWSCVADVGLVLRPLQRQRKVLQIFQKVVKMSGEYTRLLRVDEAGVWRTRMPGQRPHRWPDSASQQ